MPFILYSYKLEKNFFNTATKFYGEIRTQFIKTLCLEFQRHISFLQPEQNNRLNNPIKINIPTKIFNFYLKSRGSFPQFFKYMSETL